MSLRILTVCTGNICRSPMAAALLSAHLERAGLDAAVTSAGTHAAGFTAADRQAIAALESRGIDLRDHRPRVLDRTSIDDDGADLVLAMTRSHLRQVVSLRPAAFARTFTAKELARRLVTVAVAVAAPGRHADLGALLASAAAVGGGRRPSELMGDDPSDDVADPYRGSSALFDRIADELDQATGVIARVLAARGVSTPSAAVVGPRPDDTPEPSSRG